MNSELAMHVCSLSEEFHPNDDTELSSAVSGHAFCAICAIGHSPPHFVPIVSLTSLQGPSETSLFGPVTERSALTVFILHIRPPPAC
jgi:hypothetical protein